MLEWWTPSCFLFAWSWIRTSVLGGGRPPGQTWADNRCGQGEGLSIKRAFQIIRYLQKCGPTIRWDLLEFNMVFYLLTILFQPWKLLFNHSVFSHGSFIIHWNWQLHTSYILSGDSHGHGELVLWRLSFIDYARMLCAYLSCTVNTFYWYLRLLKNVTQYMANGKQEPH